MQVSFHQDVSWAKIVLRMALEPAFPFPVFPLKSLPVALQTGYVDLWPAWLPDRLLLVWSLPKGGGSVKGCLHRIRGCGSCVEDCLQEQTKHSEPARYCSQNTFKCQQGRNDTCDG